MSPQQAMQQIDALLSHVWMVRTFLKHSEEIEEDEELASVQRTLYDAMHSLGAVWQNQDANAYVRQIRKKIGKLRNAADQFARIQPEVSTHTNFQMAVRSLQGAVDGIESVLGKVD